MPSQGPGACSELFPGGCWLTLPLFLPPSFLGFHPPADSLQQAFPLRKTAGFCATLTASPASPAGCCLGCSWDPPGLDLRAGASRGGGGGCFESSAHYQKSMSTKGFLLWPRVPTAQLWLWDIRGSFLRTELRIPKKKVGK